YPPWTVRSPSGCRRVLRPGGSCAPAARAYASGTAPPVTCWSPWRWWCHKRCRRKRGRRWSRSLRRPVRPQGATWRNGQVPGRGHAVAEDAKILLISVAARMAGMHPQTLRQYDRLGLVCPERTPGGGRRYSVRDVAMLREIQRLSQDEGINLAGVKRIIYLEQEANELRQRITELEAELVRAYERIAELEALSAFPRRD